MNTQHTPGPWRVYDQHPTVIHVGGGYPIADTNPDGHFAPSDYYSNAETLANARLIAAAPDLLAALQAILAAKEDGTFGVDGNRGFNLAHAAIAKATGE